MTRYSRRLLPVVFSASLLWPALSAGAIIIERTVHRESYAPTPIYYEDQEETHVLRQEQDRQSIHHP